MYRSALRGTWLRDHLGPGGDLVAIGGAVYDYEYSQTTVWDPHVGRGTHLARDQAVAWITQRDNAFLYPTQGVSDPGDVDGDGAPDVLSFDGDVAWLYPGPLAGWLGWEDPLPTTGGFLSRGLPDLNGDGGPELLGYAGDIAQRQAVLLCSPFALPIDVASGARIELSGAVWGVLDEVVSGDLDGDGLIEIVDSDQHDGASRIDIYDGRDLRDACAAAR